MHTIAKIKVFLVFLYVFLRLKLLYASNVYSLGLPYIINHFSPDKPLTTISAYDITQLPNGLILIATSKGIFAYDGTDWHKLVDGNFISVAVDTFHNTLFAATNGDFGYITYDTDLDGLKYIPISSLTPHIVKNTWKIAPLANGIYFIVNRKELYKYNYKELKYIDLKGFEANNAFVINNKLFIVDDSLGIGQITSQGFMIISTAHTDVYNQKIISIIPATRRNIFYVFTRSGALYVYNMLNDKFTLIKNNIFSASSMAICVKKVDQNNFIISTLNNGLIFVDTLGNITLKITSKNGLISNSIYDVFIDKFGEIWVATSRFISTIYYSIPYRYANEKAGYQGDITDFEIFRNKLVLTTTNGIFYSDFNRINFKPISTKIIFFKQTILKLNNNLILPSMFNIYLLDTNFKLIKISSNKYKIFSFLKNSENKFIGLSFDSLYIFELIKNKLRELHSYYIPYILENLIRVNDSTFIGYSAQQNYLIRIKIEDNLINYSHIPLYRINKIYVIKSYEQKVILGTNIGLIFYDYKRNLFDYYTLKRLNNLLVNRIIRDILIDSVKFWILTDKDIILYNNKNITVYPIQRNTIFSSQRLKKWHDILIGANSYNLFFINENDLINFSRTVYEKPFLFYVAIGKKKYFYCMEKFSPIDRENDSIWVFKHKVPDNKSIKLKIALITPFLARTTYSYKINSESWSDWTNSSLIILPNLSEGKHKIFVRVKSEVTNITYKIILKITAKAPFYRSKWSAIFYLLIVIAVFYLIVQNVIRIERRRRIILERLVRRRTKQLEEKNSLLREQYKKLNEMTELLIAQKEELETQNEKLRLSNLELKQLSLVAQKTNNSVLILDNKGKIEWWNEGFVRLFKHKFKLNKTTVRQVIKNVRPDVFERIKNFKPGSAPISFTTREILQDTNKEIWYKTTITPVYDENGEIYRFVVLDVDITEIKQAEKQIKLQKNKLEQQTRILRKINQEINEHRQRLEIQHREMLSSLEYAKRIQTALLPKEDLNTLFPNHFIFARAKEIVSGDFFYFGYKQDKIIFAIADGTGHGVPGAFMSVLGITLLKDAIERNENSLYPAYILATLRQSIIKALHQTEVEANIKDGLDIALGVIDIKTQKLIFSGANIPINIIRNKEILIEIKGDRMPIGIHEFSDKPFSQEVIDLYNKDRIYLYTDGFVDQFGGPDNKRYKRTKFKKFLLSLQEFSISTHSNYLEKELDSWMQDNDQVDDITVLGIEVDFYYLRSLFKKNLDVLH